MSDDFAEALEAVFEERATEFSDDLRALLKSLFEEGVRIGRDRERSFNAEIVRRMGLVTREALRARQEVATSLGETIVAQHDGLPFGQSLTADDIRRAVREFEQQASGPGLPAVVVGIDEGRGIDETVVTTGRVNPWTSLGPTFSSLASFSTSDRSFHSRFVREMHGEYVGNSSGSPTGSGSSPSEDDPSTDSP